MQPDIFAISSCDIDASIYLNLPDKNGPLQSIRRNWFGKIFMRLGLSTSSKALIIDYIVKRIQPKDVNQLRSQKACHTLLRLFKKEKNIQIDNLRVALYDRMKKIYSQLELSKSTLSKESSQKNVQIPIDNTPTKKEISKELVAKQPTKISKETPSQLHLSENLSAENASSSISLKEEQNVQIPIDNTPTKKKIFEEIIKQPHIAPKIITTRKCIDISAEDSLLSIDPSVLRSGIRNTGASCYMNATVQALIRIPYFLELLQKTASEFASKIKQTLDLMKNEKAAVSCKNAKSLLSHFCEHGWSKFLENPSKLYTEMASAAKFYEEFLAEKFNLKFQWSLQNTTSASKPETAAINIPLKYIENDTTIQDIVENYPTSRGKKKIYLTKEHPPEILPFFLLGKNELKTQKRILPSLAISLPTDKENCPLIYDLASVIVHEGDDIHSGHFLTFSSQETPNGKKMWVCYNDHRVTHHEIDDETTIQTLSTEGYILFYKKRSASIENFSQ